MLTKEQELHGRYLHLLCKAGTRLLKLLAEKALDKMGMTLSQFLNSHKTTVLKDRHLTTAQKDTLYPGTPQGADIDDFDISLLAHLILSYPNFHGHLHSKERQAVEQIRNIRNHYGHSSITAMTTTTYTAERKQLLYVLQTGRADLTEKENKELIDIEMAALEDSVDEKTVEEMQEYIKQSGNELKYIRKGQEHLMDSLNKTQTVVQDAKAEQHEIYSRIQHMEIGGKQTAEQLLQISKRVDRILRHLDQTKISRSVEIPALSCIIFISAADQKTACIAEHLLFNEFEAFIAKSPPEDDSSDKLKLCVEKFLNGFHNLQITVDKVEKGSVVLKLTVVSLRGIPSLLDYVQSRRCLEVLQEMSEVLTDILESTLSITAYVDQQILEDIISHMCREYGIGMSDIDDEKYPCDSDTDQIQAEAQEQFDAKSTQRQYPSLSEDLTVTSLLSNIKAEDADRKHKIQFQVKCSSIGSLKRLLEEFIGGRTENVFDELSAALSSTVGKPVTLHSSINMEQLLEAIESIERQLGIETEGKDMSSDCNIEKRKNQYVKTAKQQISDDKNSDFQYALGEGYEADESHSKTISEQLSIKALQENEEEGLIECVYELPSQTEQSDTASKETKVRRVALGDRVFKSQSTGDLHENVEKPSEYSSKTDPPSSWKVQLTRSKSFDPRTLQRPPSHITIYRSLKRGETLKPYLESAKASNTSEETEETATNSDEDIVSIPVSENSDTSDTSAQVHFSLECIECVKAIPVFSREEIEVGDHIIFAGRIYDHHGIVVAKPDTGNKLTIVEVTNTISGFFVGRKAVLASSDKEFDFARQKIWVVHYRERVFPKTTVADRAIKFKDDTYRYDLMDNNCENFASFCATGKKFSIQVTKLRLTFRLFLSSGFRGISDELIRNKREYENNIICKQCYDMNTILLSVDVKPITQPNQVKAGDIIRYSYWNFWHDAVVLQVKDKQPKYIICEIAHYAFCGLLSHRQIKSEDLQIYFDGKSSKLDYKSPEYNVYDPETVVKRARQRLGEQEFVFFSNDSSHYSRWCKLRLEKPVEEFY